MHLAVDTPHLNKTIQEHIADALTDTLGCCVIAKRPIQDGVRLRSIMAVDDHRKTVLAILDQHRPSDAEERDDVDSIKGFVDAHSDCFGKVNPSGHITGSAFVIDPKGRILMTFHRKLQRWLQLGGHGTPTEINPADTALREALEESGLSSLSFHPEFGSTPFDIDMHIIPARKGEPAHPHLDFRYVFITERPDDIVCSEESSALKWLDRERLLEMTFDPALNRALQKIWSLT